MKSPAPNQASQPASSPGPTLLQFATSDTLANLLPALALRPARIIHVQCSDAANGDHFKHALRAATQEPAFKNWQPKVIDLALNKPSPAIADTREQIAATLIANPGTIINFTGGTKLVSMGAFLAAQALGRPSFYCDVAAARCIDGNTARFDKWPDLREVSGNLGMRLLMALQGKNLDDWRDEPVTQPLRNFGLKAFELRNKQWGVLDNLSKTLRTWFFGTQERAPQNPDELRALLAKPVTGQALTTEPAKHYLEAAVAANLVRIDNAGLRLTAQPERRAVERSVHLLLSTWLELAVFDCLQRNPRFKEARWCPTPTNQANADDTGIVCVDHKHGTLLYIACFATLTRSIQEHVDAINERARRLGANASAFILFKPHPGQEPTLRAAAKRAGIDVAIEADEIVKLFAPGA